LRHELFSRTDDPVRRALQTFIERSPAQDPRGILEDLYLRARMQRFAGRNITTTGFFCEQGLPYFGNSLVDVTLALPYRMKSGGWVVRKAIMHLAPALAKVPLDSGVAVSPQSWRRPDAILRAKIALGRKVLQKYGGQLGRRISAIPEEVPWSAARGDDRFRSFVSDVLLDRDAQIDELVDRERRVEVIDKAFGGASLSPLGLLLTLELTLQRVRSSPPSPGR
jgi:hypothetical protein